ncbi:MULTISPECIES: hypothetical protein [Bacteroides]|uniref:hypothetical protein n=1 Tax=Bacteroides TaxID=816 RepID=UPI000A7259BA|nr:MULTISPECIES: hypothetical protein [Bacteroides]
MKTLRLIGIAVIAIIMNMSFISCSDDEEIQFSIPIVANTNIPQEVLNMPDENGNIITVPYAKVTFSAITIKLYIEDGKTSDYPINFEVNSSVEWNVTEANSGGINPVYLIIKQTVGQIGYTNNTFYLSLESLKELAKKYSSVTNWIDFKDNNGRILGRLKFEIFDLKYLN